MKTQPLTEEAVAALEARGIDSELAERYGAASVVPSRPTDRIWVAFAHLRQETRVHWTARTVDDGPKKFTQKSGADGRCLWNQDVIFDASLMGQTPLIITEGHLDALAIMTAGFRAVVSVPDGAPGAGEAMRAEDDPAAKAKYRYLAGLRDQLRMWPSIIVAADDDDPGRRLRDDLSRVIGRSRIRVMDYGTGCKDANDLLLAGGGEAVVAAVEAAKWLDIGGIYEWDTWPDMAVVKAVDAGVPGVDGLWRFRPGELSVLTGYPNAGKTMLANQIAHALAKRHGWVCCLFSPEQQPQIQRERMLQCHLGKPDIESNLDEVRQADAFLRDHMVLLKAERDQPATVDWLCERIATVAWRYNCRLIVVDPWNQLDHDRPIDLREDEYERESLRRLGEAAMEYGVHVMLLVHPRKPSNVVDPPLPCAYAISGSGHWANRPDVGCSIYRGKSDTTISVWKARYADGKWYDNGRVGQHKVVLDKRSMSFVLSMMDDASATETDALL